MIAVVVAAVTFVFVDVVVVVVVVVAVTASVSTLTVLQLEKHIFIVILWRIKYNESKKSTIMPLIRQYTTLTPWLSTPSNNHLPK